MRPGLSKTDRPGLSILERKLQCKLNLPCWKGTADNTEKVTIDVRVRRLEIRPVEDIKEFGTKLQPRCFGDRNSKLFLHGQIEIKIAIAAGNIAARVSEWRKRRRTRNTAGQKIADSWVGTVSAVDRIT